MLDECVQKVVSLLQKKTYALGPVATSYAIKRFSGLASISIACWQDK